MMDEHHAPAAQATSPTGASSQHVTLVMPTYNRAAYLRYALDACLAQTYPQWELIVVDDASTDETPTVLAEYAARDARIRVVRHAQNRRLPAALNTGMRASSGEWVTWISDDDRMRPHALERLITYLAAHPETDFIYSDYDLIDASGQMLRTKTVTEPLQLIVLDDPVTMHLYRRSIFDALGGYADDLFLAEDYDFLLRVLAARYRMVPLHENLFEYRRHEGSLSDTYRGKTFRAAESALLRALPQLQWTGRGTLGVCYLHLASLATWQHAYARAARYTVLGVAYTPGQACAKIGQYLGKRLAKVQVST